MAEPGKCCTWDSRRDAVLNELKPLCLALVKDRKAKDAEALAETILCVDKNVVQDLQSFLLFPLHTVLGDATISDSLVCEVCRAITAIFEVTKIYSAAVFFQVYYPIIYQLTPEDLSQKSVKCSEDAKWNLVTAASRMLLATDDKVLHSIYTIKKLPAFGQLSHLLILLAEKERWPILQDAALEALLVIYQSKSEFGKTYGAELGDLFAFSVPGVTIGATNIILGDYKQGHRVMERALYVFGRCVSMVMGDSGLQKSQLQTVKPHMDASDNPRLAPMNVKRDDAWVKTTASKLHILIDKICKKISHSGYRTKLALIRWSNLLLKECSQSLKDSVPQLLEVLIGLINDQMDEVTKEAQIALKMFVKAQAGTGGDQTLIEMLQQNLYTLATTLPRQVKMCDEDDKPTFIKLLRSYITVLGPNISCVVLSSPHLQRLCLALVQSLEPDLWDVKIMEERSQPLNHDDSMFTDSMQHSVWKPKKYFKLFRDDAVLAELLQVCRLLGKYGDLPILVDHLLDIYQESAIYKPAAIMIINEIVSGTDMKDTDNPTFVLQKSSKKRKDIYMLNDIVRMLLDEYLSEENLRLADFYADKKPHLPKSYRPPSAASFSSSLLLEKADTAIKGKMSTADRNGAVFLQCLFMEGIAKFAAVLKPLQFESHLTRALYPLVENVGHENVCISSTAYSALVDICEVHGYCTMDQLLQMNADYLVNSVSLRLRHFQQNHRALQTIGVMLRYCTHHLLPLIEHSISEFLDTLDDNYSENLALFMPVLLELSKAIWRWFPPSQNLKGSQPTGQPQAQNNTFDCKSVVVYIEEYIEKKRIAEMENDAIREIEEEVQQETNRTLEEIGIDVRKLLEEDKTSEEDMMEDSENSEPSEPPKHVHVVQNIFQTIKYLLPSQDPRIKIQSLDIVCQCCLNLQEHNKQLLPQLHQLWPSFCPLFKSEHKFIINKAILTLRMMSEISGDFLRHRSMKVVFPLLFSFMESQGAISSASKSTYTHTSHYKLQLCVLQNVGHIANNLHLDGNDLYLVASMCVPYLSDIQPISLQKACLAAFPALISLDPDAMWLLLCKSYCPHPLVRPSEDFPAIEFPTTPETKNSFTTNISELFKQFYD